MLALFVLIFLITMFIMYPLTWKITKRLFIGSVITVLILGGLVVLVVYIVLWCVFKLCEVKKIYKSAKMF